ncbi:MAG: META domain-containing protein [Prevotella sp.]|nr:META domain-containing protein [Prevotella sp.]MDY3271226.1 META domain-containing protein [Prevotella sp.]MDY3897374.1 META domain-containing protein [Prevotella sp.]MDY5084294.1 META domain-containing protein [Prevotella sp.]
MNKNFFYAAMAAALLASCSTSQKATSLTALNGEWNIEKIEGKAIDKSLSENEAFLGFDTAKKSVYGCTGCNRLTGSFDIDSNNVLDLSKMGSTRMMCKDMTTETMVLGALQKVKTFKVDKKGNLLLTNEKGNTIIELTKKK